MGWVLTALQNAFWQLLHAPSLEAGVIDTVSRGGDTDTTAAIAGALLGAVHGRDAVPDRWRRAVLTCRPLPGTATRHPRPMEFWPVDALELAEALLAAGRDGAAV
jgi:ADP-ribosylglycohydrolase